MPTHGKKERQQKRQQRKRRQRKRLEARRRVGRARQSGGGHGVPAPYLPLPEPARSQPREKTPIDLWWEAYMEADGQERLRMIREKLESVGPQDDWYGELFPEAVSELQGKLSADEYVAFLEEVREQRPDVFAMSADWHARSMAFVYIAHQRYEQLEDVVRAVASGLDEIDEPLFSLMSLLRLAGQERAAQVLVDAVIPLVGNSALMGWAVDELIEWGMFAAYRRCVAAGATDRAIEEAYQFSLHLGVEDTDRSRRHQRDFALHLAGKAGKHWTRDDFLKGDKQVGRKVFLMLADFTRWLCRTRNLPPIVADELRRLLVRCIDGMECPVNAFIKGLKRDQLEPFLAGKLNFLSLDRAHAPATVVGMLHFYDFLAEQGLVNEAIRSSTARTCTTLWRELKRVVRDEWRSYEFLERYLPKPLPVQ